MGDHESGGRRPKLRDSDLDAEMLADGYVVVRHAARRIVRGLRGVHRHTGGRVPAGFHSTMWSSDDAYKAAVHSELRAAMHPLLDELLDEYRPMLANFVTKGRGGRNGTMPRHQDWTFVDESSGSSWNVWIPLVDVDTANGCISVLPKSHRLAPTVRGTGTTDPFDRIDDPARWMIDLPMEAGDVLIHDHRLVHGSPPNRRRRPRVVAAAAIVARHAKLIHYQQRGDGVLRRYRIDDSFFIRHTFGAPTLPSGVVIDADVRFRNPKFSEADLDRLAGLVCPG